MWKYIDNCTRLQPSNHSSLKQHLLNFISRRVDVPHSFFHGPRTLSIIHTRIRNKCSDLKFDLYNERVSDTNKCELCDGIKTAELYVFRCYIYVEHRTGIFLPNFLLYVYICVTHERRTIQLLNIYNCLSQLFVSYYNVCLLLRLFVHNLQSLQQTTSDDDKKLWNVP